MVKYEAVAQYIALLSSNWWSSFLIPAASVFEEFFGQNTEPQIASKGIAIVVPV